MRTMKLRPFLDEVEKTEEKVIGFNWQYDCPFDIAYLLLSRELRKNPDNMKKTFVAILAEDDEDRARMLEDLKDLDILSRKHIRVVTLERMNARFFSIGNCKYLISELRYINLIDNPSVLDDLEKIKKYSSKYGFKYLFSEAGFKEIARDIHKKVFPMEDEEIYTIE